MWLDIAPGGESRADMGTQQIRFTALLVKKGGFLSGSEPFLIDSEDVTCALLKQAHATRQTKAQMDWRPTILSGHTKSSTGR
jgi:hypothetical protein